jgi:hypothetical protein
MLYCSGKMPKLLHEFRQQVADLETELLSHTVKTTDLKSQLQSLTTAAVAKPPKAPRPETTAAQRALVGQSLFRIPFTCVYDLDVINNGFLSIPYEQLKLTHLVKSNNFPPSTPFLSPPVLTQSFAGFFDAARK